MKYLVVIIVLFVIVVSSFSALHKSNIKKFIPSSREANIIRFLPLGDSYTIGQNVSENDRWPNQLAHQLNLSGKPVRVIANPAVTGYTTRNLITKELPTLHHEKPDFVTLQIGVNDWVQGVPTATFRSNLRYIIDDIQTVLSNKKRLVLVTIPDFSLTPTGSSFGSPVDNRVGIESFNRIIKEEAIAHELQVADIYPASQKVANDASLTANDGLHPSAKQYDLWVEIIKPIALSVI
ncbi:MAG: SGNH/GDSL hydrolase family protein [Candidatus Saccharimonadales bacterium]